MRIVNRALSMRADWAPRHVMELLLTAMMPENRLALEVSMATGLRMGDVLAIRTEQARKGRFTIAEEKTGKHRRVYIPLKLRERMFRQAGRFFVWEGRLDAKKHRTRQAVYKDLVRVAKLYRIDGRKIKAHISTHTGRKIWAVEMYQRTGSLQKVQALLNHENESVTLLYALADVLTEREHGDKMEA